MGYKYKLLPGQRLFYYLHRKRRRLCVPSRAHRDVKEGPCSTEPARSPFTKAFGFLSLVHRVPVKYRLDPGAGTCGSWAFSQAGEAPRPAWGAHRGGPRAVLGSCSRAWRRGANRWLQCVCESVGVQGRAATPRSSSLRDQVRWRVIGVGGGGNASFPQSDKALSS